MSYEKDFKDVPIVRLLLKVASRSDIKMLAESEIHQATHSLIITQHSPTDALYSFCRLFSLVPQIDAKTIHFNKNDASDSLSLAAVVMKDFIFNELKNIPDKELFGESECRL